MAFEDKTLVCADCGAEFTFSAEDQEFHSARGYQDPKRCPPCRQARRSERGGGGRDRGERIMYDVVCSGCGAQCQVPFQPRLDKPVYCDECFAKQKAERPQW